MMVEAEMSSVFLSAGGYHTADRPRGSRAGGPAELGIQESEPLALGLL